MISNIFSKIQNGFLSKKNKIIFKFNSKILINILTILINEGFIYGYTLLNYNKIIVFLKYNDNKILIKKIETFSKKKKYKYMKYNDILNLQKSLNLYIISTTKGLVSLKTAIKYKQGGKLICKVE